MARYILKRLLGTIPLALGVVTLVFVLLEAAPGTPVDLLLGDRPVPAEVRERLEQAYGFDRPAGERYLRWVGAVLFRGELGWSPSRSKPVAELVAQALPPTLALASSALLLHVFVGILLGVSAATRRGRWQDHTLTLGSLVLYSMPTFWVALMSILGLSYSLPLFPASSVSSIGAESWPLWKQLADRLWHLALPAAVLGLASAAAMARFVRSGLLRTLGREFIRAAQARGVDGRRIVLVHALRNALLPVINLIGLSLPILISGSLVIEVVFAWPGMGRLTYDAIRAQDFAVVLATTLLATLLVVLGNLAADVVMALVDPRIRLGGRTEPRGD